MAVLIKFNHMTLLHCKNSIFEVYYEKLDELAAGIPLTSELKKLIENLEKGQYGIGLNIADYVKSKSDLSIFAKLTEEAIEKYNAEYDLPQEYQECLKNFYNNLNYLLNSPEVF